MPRTSRLLAVALVLLAAGPAAAVILKLIPLKDAIDGEQLIFVAKVDAIDPDKPSVTLKLDETLKGEVPFDRLPVNLSGDAEAKKGGHTKVMLDRLDPARKVVVFASKKGSKYNAMAFTEGTWFSLQGTVDADGKTVRWAFLHAEPYLRRTFKGTTAELAKAVADALAGKAEPPKVDEKEPAGYGPAVEGRGAGGKGQEKKGPADPGFSLAPRPSPLAPPLAVIPSFVLVGPLALVAALFPGVAARLAVGMRRWRAFLVVASVNSTLALVYWLLREQGWLPDVGWAASYAGFTAVLLASTAVGLVWAGRRYRRMAADDPAATAPAAAGELAALVGLAVFVGLIAVAGRLLGATWAAATVDLPMREFTLIGLGLVAALLYAGYRVLTRDSDGPAPAVRLGLSGETVALGAVFLGGLVGLLAGGDRGGPTVALQTVAGDADAAFGPRLADVKVWELPGAQQVMSGFGVDGGLLYVGASRRGLTSSEGFVYAVDRHTGQVGWRFDHDGDLKPVFSTPAVAAGRVYFGEGLHEDSGCRLFAVDGRTGKPVWARPFETASHTEGRPLVAGGRVVFSAGDDGLVCADAASGGKVWQYPAGGGLHVDTPPAASGGRLFVGSGYGSYALVGVDAATGAEAWRVPQTLRAFGPPLVLGDRVAYGLGTGNLTTDVLEAEAEPAGAVVCVEAATGNEVWRYALTRSVHTPLAADAFSVYATSRDGAVHCLDRKSGKLRWKASIGATLTAGPAVATSGGLPVAVYAVSTDGLMVCLNPQSGRVVWSRDLREHTGKSVEEVYATPLVVAEETPGGSRRAVYTGAMLRHRTTGARAAAVIRFDDELGE